MGLQPNYLLDCQDAEVPGLPKGFVAGVYNTAYPPITCHAAQEIARERYEPFRKFDKATSQGVPQNVAMAMFGLQPAGNELSLWDQFTQFVEGSYIVLSGTAKLGSDLYDGNYTGVVNDIAEVQRKGENAQNRWNANATQAQILSAAADYKRAFDAEDYGKAYRILSGDPVLVSQPPPGGNVNTPPTPHADPGMSTGAKVATGIAVVAGGALLASSAVAVATHTPFVDVWRHLFEHVRGLSRSSKDER